MTRSHATSGQASLAGLKRLAEGLDRYRRLRRTRAALRALSIDARLDLDIFEGDIDRIARRAVGAA